MKGIVNRTLIVSIVINNICWIHLAQDDYRNHLHYHLEEYTKQIQYIVKRTYCFIQKTQLSFGILEEIELLKRRFQDKINQNRPVRPRDRAGEETLEDVNWHERVLRKVLGHHHPE